MASVTPIPPHAVLVHIGPYKTGTTAIQAMLAEHRPELERHGVWYPGEGNRHAREGWSLRGRSPKGLPPEPPHVWEDFATAIRARSQGRVCVSTEDLVNLDARQVRKAVDDLGADRFHMLMVARRLDKLIPSAWQQRVKTSQETLTFDEFVRTVTAPTRQGPSDREFWRNHDVGQVLDRWLAALPAEQVSVLVADEGDHEQLPRVFEALLGLPIGLLAGGVQENTSLTLERAEFYRRLGLVFERRGWPAGLRRKVMVRGLLKGLMSAPRRDGEARIPGIPGWADERLVELSRARRDAIRDAGCRVIGDPDQLLYHPQAGRDEQREAPEAVGIDAAVAAVESLIEVFAAGPKRKLGSSPSVPKTAPVAATEADVLAGVSSRRMLREIARRQAGRIPLR